VSQAKSRGFSAAEVHQAEEVLNPHALTIGFARRFASYKRATLLFHDLDRLEKILNNNDCPVQIVFAGKAHPQDNAGKELIRKIVNIAAQPRFRNHIVFLENYDINVARYMVQGVDVWMNTPRRPLEASGTSGMKAGVNGVLNVSILDGWWCEGHNQDNGWAIGSGEEYHDDELQDDIEGEELYRLLEKDIIPLFYERDRAGLPRHWIKMVKASISTIGSEFNTHRMLIEYVESYYLRAHEAGKSLQKDDGVPCRELTEWRDHVEENWHHVTVGRSALEGDDSGFKLDEQIGVTVPVWPGNLEPKDIRVEAYYGKLDAKGQINPGRIVELKPDEEIKDGFLYRGELKMNYHGRCGYAIRVYPDNELLIHPFTPLQMKWE